MKTGAQKAVAGVAMAVLNLLARLAESKLARTNLSSYRNRKHK